ncbi:MAG: leucyl/phenylalanyl-tRNA--protein transferase [Acidobacteria bacterium]|jgi:leucyl/phenylalanyl-tRNA--protein transferase|nr:leucyl/phenylalanyl-tRNA--protein transferase [Acidobacteriota bacterium]
MVSSESRKGKCVIEPPFLLQAYRQGYFPMAMEDGDIGWFSPDPRAILPLESMRVSRRLARVVRSSRFDVVIDGDFEGVMRACAAGRDEGTWISEDILESYVALHRLGVAHSVEAWRDGRLAGGLYGVHLGGAFFGESMFHHETDASKVALVALVLHMRARHMTLLDIQWVTPHLAQFGAVEIAKADYMRRLTQAIDIPCTFV